MNVPCGLIQDLLPLYYDEVCSQESRSLVEEHLAECPACRQRLADLSAPLPTPEEKEETAALKEVLEENPETGPLEGGCHCLSSHFSGRLSSVADHP